MNTTSLAVLAVTCLVAAGPSLAAEGPADPKRAEAAEHFARGLHLFENQDNQGALAAFQRAYELIPNRIVLFNIGLVHASLGDPVNAVDALGTVLETPELLQPERAARARQVKEEQERKIGWLRVTTNVPADLDIDGVVVGRTPLTSPLRVAGGERLVGAVADGHQPIRREVAVPAGSQVELALELRANRVRPALVLVAAAVPGADVLVDGVPAGRTPLAAPLVVEPGSRVIELRRPGYLPQSQHLLLAAGEQARARFDLRPEPGLAPSHYGRVSVVSPEAGAFRLTVDGQNLGPYRGGVLLPAGPHRVRFERDGFEPVERTIHVVAGADHPLQATLRPTLETRQAYRSRIGRYRVLAISTLAGGLAIAAGSGGYTYWSSGKLDSANTRLAKVQADWRWGGGGACDQSQGQSSSQQSWCAEQLASAQDEVATYRSHRIAGIVGISIGAALAVTGVVLLAAGQDPKRFDDKNVDVLSLSPSWQPVVSVGPAGGGLGLAGRF